MQPFCLAHQNMLESVALASSIVMVVMGFIYHNLSEDTVVKWLVFSCMVASISGIVLFIVYHYLRTRNMELLAIQELELDNDGDNGYIALDDDDDDDDDDIYKMNLNIGFHTHNYMFPF